MGLIRWLAQEQGCSVDDKMSATDPFPPSPVLPQAFGEDKVIRFRCHRGIACWNACCSNIDISLTPYDIVRLKQRLDLSSTEFLDRYTVPYEFEKDGIAGVKLKPVDGGTACRFMRPEGCGVYEDRPTACRYYPVALLSMRKQGEATDSDSYALVQEPHCKGHEDARTISIADYRAEQGLRDYDELARGWRQLILKKKSSGPTIGKPSKRSLQLFFMTCYDVDRFRTFVASDGFAEIYDVADDELKAVFTDDVAALQFGFRFLRQVLFGEMSITMKEGKVEERRARMAAQRARLEREAAERMARDEME
jgi:Fe-S-cluster containining protein